MDLLEIMHLLTPHAIRSNRSQGSQATYLPPWLAPAQLQPQPSSLPASCLEFHDPSGRERAAWKRTRRLPSADTKAGRKAHKTKATRWSPQAAKSTFFVPLPFYSLICFYTHSTQDNVKFLNLSFSSLWKVGRRLVRTAWLLFQTSSQGRRRRRAPVAECLANQE